MEDYDPFMWQDNMLRQRVRAYKQLLSGSESLLQQGALFWTERLLLKIVRALYSKRFEQAAEIFPPDWLGYEDGEESLLEALVEATLGGHDLGSWEKTDKGYQAACKLCQATTWIGDDGMRYSLLKDTCPDRRETH